ncbi:hypothetical protein B4U80_09954 [Leptotrombidium deliense]|uniref:SH3 domain-binding protein 5-like protein n=1 Tax=Leptotrombidium deliense TaxID=299467 RepID=A0A443SAR7_9ACAR|nr:hypothetical protein B4U80_09954 [Leptotrombidium deliense]
MSLQNEANEHKEYEGDAEEETLDPRVKQQLETLNQWTEKINALEKRFEESNALFRCVLNESSDKLKCLAHKLGKCVREARPYYDAKRRTKELQLKCQRAAINFEKACQLYEQSKETISLTEERFAAHKQYYEEMIENEKGDKRREFDNTWQEMLNQATIKLMNAEMMRRESELKHERCMALFRNSEEKATHLEKQLKSSIKKSRTYFEEQYKFHQRLHAIKGEIETLRREITDSKSAYSMTLRNLESISEEIHEKRNRSLLQSSLKREPGVGAETNEVPSESVDKCSVPELNVSSSRCQLQIVPKSVAVFDVMSNSSPLDYESDDADDSSFNLTSLQCSLDDSKLDEENDGAFFEVNLD